MKKKKQSPSVIRCFCVQTCIAIGVGGCNLRTLLFSDPARSTRFNFPVKAIGGGEVIIRQVSIVFLIC